MVAKKELSIAISAQLEELLKLREQTFCPSEIARKISPDDWRPLMPLVHQIAEQWAQEGKLLRLQKGEIQPDGPIKGPYRIKNKR